MFAAFFDSHGNNSKMLATTPERSVCALAGPPPPHKHVERPIDKPAGKGGFSAKDSGIVLHGCSPSPDAWADSTSWPRFIIYRRTVTLIARSEQGPIRHLIHRRGDRDRITEPAPRAPVRALLADRVISVGRLLSLRRASQSALATDRISRPASSFPKTCPFHCSLRLLQP